MTSPPVVDHVHENGSQLVELLPATNDEHGGIIVDMKEAMEPATFSMVLRASISQWKRQGKKGVWIKLPIKLVNLVETAVKEGFWYHHAEPHYLMLVCWIAETTSTIPANATHRVGIGAVVLKDGNEGEDIFEAAVREVKEETGVSHQFVVDTEFSEILAFGQSHKTFFDKSDLLFLCMMRPLSFDIQKQELEIEAAQWMPFEEYAAQPFIQKHGLSKCITNICSAKLQGNYSGFSPRPTTSFFSNNSSYLYLNSWDLS
ncbi:hypothetical protein TIFTF001_031432 [Ficus carica]|uniref:Nudix hydrolase domain-containing protein n=1 Tax=Ficus carica TaxID=3494 RepID=A0AA88DV92_FICCA|nr:hypothetical protein TIFTF001_031432 [Ficus carica]